MGAITAKATVTASAATMAKVKDAATRTKIMQRPVLYTLTSGLHGEMAPDARQEPFIRDLEAVLGVPFDCRDDDFGTYGQGSAELIYVRTGGTEGLFLEKVAPLLRAEGTVRLLTSGQSNSLAASMEILSWLRQRGFAGEILHGSAADIAARLSAFSAPTPGAEQARFAPGDAKNCLRGAEEGSFAPEGKMLTEPVGPETFGRILDGLTLRCFDLLTALHNTGCLALAILNAEGTTATCEGDIPAMLSMAVARALTGGASFQVNLSRIEGDRLLFAHCTVPLSLVRDYCYDTHFESGIGVAVHGELPEGPVTIFKLSPDCRRMFRREARLVANTYGDALCRTQVVVEAPGAAEYFLRTPVGNHHILVPGKM